MNAEPYELRLLKRLLSQFVELTGLPPAILEQAAEIEIIETLRPGETFSSVELKPRSGEPAPELGANPITGVLDDEDGSPIVAQILMKDGLLCELAIFKADGSDILSLPQPELARVYDTRDYGTSMYLE